VLVLNSIYYLALEIRSQRILSENAVGHVQDDGRLVLFVQLFHPVQDESVSGIDSVLTCIFSVTHCLAQLFAAVAVGAAHQQGERSGDACSSDFSHRLIAVSHQRSNLFFTNNWHLHFSTQVSIERCPNDIVYIP